MSLVVITTIPFANYMPLDNNFAAFMQFADTKKIACIKSKFSHNLKTIISNLSYSLSAMQTCLLWIIIWQLTTVF